MPTMPFTPQGRPLVVRQGFQRTPEQNPPATVVPSPAKTTAALIQAQAQQVATDQAQKQATQAATTTQGSNAMGTVAAVVNPPAPTPEASIEDLLGKVAGLMQKLIDSSDAILKELREQVQKGYVYPVTLVTNGLIPIDTDFNPPLFSVSLINDGPGTIQYRIPNIGSAFWVDLAPTEVQTVNFIKGKIPSVAIRGKTASVTATVRLVGTY